MTSSPDAADVAWVRTVDPFRHGGRFPCQAPRSGSVAEEKGGARGQTLCQLIVQRVGRAGGGVARLGASGPAKTHTLLAFWQGQAAN